MVLDTVPRLHVVNAYTPQAGRPTAEKEEFYEQLQKVVRQIPTKDQYMIIGDFNAKLNGRTEDENNYIGPHVYNPDEETKRQG